jgi:truncated hemoglobin YjbI
MAHGPDRTAAWRKLAEAFYARVQLDPVLRPLFPGKTLHCAIEEFTAFLVQFFGGPAADSQRRWWLSLRESHARFEIGPQERTAWLENMNTALEEPQMEEPLRAALREFFEQSSAYVVNSQPAASNPAEPTSEPIRQEIRSRWNAQCALDDAIAALRDEDAERAISLAQSDILRARFQLDQSTLTGLLAQMMRGANPILLRYIQEEISRDPALVQERYAGRTLLHDAASLANLALVEVLLSVGANPNAPDGGSHTPLYSLANQYNGPNGGTVVRALAQSGAKVNANGGAKRCTALHMAARRGNVEIAEALLECGADIDARDSLGDTPLRRSVNCDKTQVASLLLAKGADAHSIGNKGLTPLLAARSGAMKAILRVSSTRF